MQVSALHRPVRHQYHFYIFYIKFTIKSNAKCFGGVLLKRCVSEGTSRELSMYMTNSRHILAWISVHSFHKGSAIGDISSVMLFFYKLALLYASGPIYVLLAAWAENTARDSLCFNVIHFSLFLGLLIPGDCSKYTDTEFRVNTCWQMYKYLVYMLHIYAIHGGGHKSWQQPVHLVNSHSLYTMP